MSSSNELSSLYSQGDIILQNPIESGAIFLVVVIVCASIEYLFTLAGEVRSKFFRIIFDTISEEVLVVGVLSLMLTFGSSFFKSLPSQWGVMFQWAHICLLFMGIAFVVLVVITVVAVLSGNGKWKKFEQSRMVGSPEGLSSHELKYRQSWEKFGVALRAYGYASDLTFADYLMKGEKQNLVALGNLTWKSWLALSTIVVVNALRTRLNPTHPSDTDPNILLNDTDTIINVSAFIALVGYGTLALFLYVYFTLQQRYRQYLMLGSRSTALDGEDKHDQPLVVSKLELDDPQSFLLWQNSRSTMSLVQACLMFFVWYIAVFFLNMIYSTFSFNVGLMLLLIAAAVVPVLVFLALLPWTVTTVAALSTLGTSLNEKWVKSLVAQSEGKSITLTRTETDQSRRRQQSIVKKSLHPVQLDDQTLLRLSKSTALASNDEEIL